MFIASTYATTRMPTHQARATQMSLPTGCPANRSRIELTMDVTGWCSANHRTGAGIVFVGTKAELMNGRKMSGYANALAPSTDVAVSPGITAIHVSARVNTITIPATASHASGPAPDRKPMRRATSTTTTTEIRLATTEVIACAHSTDAREIGMDWNLSKMPLFTSRNSRNAVYEMPEAIVMSRMPGSR